VSLTEPRPQGSGCAGNARSSFAHHPENQDAIVFSGDAQDFRIGRAVWNCACGLSKIYRRLSSEQTFPDVRIDIGVGLKSEFSS